MKVVVVQEKKKEMWWWWWWWWWWNDNRNVEVVKDGYELIDVNIVPPQVNRVAPHKKSFTPRFYTKQPNLLNDKTTIEKLIFMICRFLEGKPRPKNIDLPRLHV